MKVSELSPVLSGESKDAKELDLTAFRPVLSKPTYLDVAQKAEALEWEQAARLMEERLAQQITKSDSSVLELLRAHYVAGMLQLRAGNPGAARTHFEHAVTTGRAEQSGWLVLADAALHAAELALEEKEARHAEERLQQVEQHAERTRWLELMGRTQLALGNSSRAETHFAEWTRLVRPVELPAAEAPSPDAPVRSARLWWARALLQQARTRQEAKDSNRADASESRPEKEGPSLARRARQQLFLALFGLPARHPLTEEAEPLLAEAVALGAAASQVESLDHQLAHLRGLIDAREHEEANVALASIQLPKEAQFSTEGCQLAYLEGKLRQSEREWGKAADALAAHVARCTEDPDLHSWLLFNAGKYSAADGRNHAAVRYYAELEELYPKSTLADDARLRAAKCYEEMGSEAKFVQMLSSMPEDYPQGDMTREGVMLLALREMQAHRWSIAAGVLERASAVIRDRDSERGHEYAGTERYFWARCLMELGEEDRALEEYEALVTEVPLSYYMLHAYSRLLEADRERAATALEQGLERARETPFTFPHRAVYSIPSFLRGMELLRVSDTERGRAVLSEQLLASDDASLMWGLALLFDRVGDAHHAHGLARGMLTDWLAHYPEGDWESAWQIGFPRPYLDIVKRESQATGVPPWLIYGVMREESTFRPRVVSHANAYGLMQIIPPTARGIGRKSGHPSTPSALKEPANNIAIGSRVLQQLGRRFRNNPLLAIPGYNAGPGRPVRWLAERPNVEFDLWVELIPFRETRRYTKRVLASRAAYAFLYDREQSQAALVMPRRLRFD